MSHQNFDSREQDLRGLLTRAAADIPADADLSGPILRRLADPRRPARGVFAHASAPHRHAGATLSAALVVALIVASLVLLRPSPATQHLSASSATATAPRPTATTATVPVPNFVNMTYTDALATAQNLHLQLKPTTQANQAPKDTIIAQDPPAGTAVPLGFTVSVTVSSGPNKITIPDVSNKTEQDALATLARAGFTNVTPQHQINTTVPAGIVIGTDPTAGTSALPDAAITLIVSSGSGTSP